MKKTLSTILSVIACYSIFFLGSYAIASVCPFSFSDVDPLASISFEALDTLQHQYKATSQKGKILAGLKHKKICRFLYDSKDTYIDFSDSFDRYKFTEFVSYSPATLNSYIKTLTYQKVDEEYLEALAYYNGIVQDYSQNTLILDTKIGHSEQIYSLSCEANTLADLINYYYKKHAIPAVKEQTIVNKIPYDTTTFVRKGATNYWGDPDKGFVGNINGSLFNLNNYAKSYSRGYGVYAAPLIPLINRYIGSLGYEAYKSNFLADFSIIRSLVSGHPIMFWYIYPYRGEALTQALDIITPSGKKKTLRKNQHVGLLAGASFDTYMRVKEIYYYDGLSPDLQTMDRKNFTELTSYFDEYIYIKNSN